MALVVLVVDSDTGALVDVAGNVREGGRYGRFARRMLSTDANPVLDFGTNGGDTLTVTKGGSAGNVVLDANVSISGGLTVRGVPITGQDSGGGSSAIHDIVGTDNQVDVRVRTVTDESGEDRNEAVISLAADVLNKVDMVPRMVSKQEIANAIVGLDVGDRDTLEDVKGTLRTLLARLSSIVNE